MTRKEFIKGIIIITAFVCLYFIFAHPVIPIKPKVTLKKQYNIVTTIDEKGEVEVEVNE